MSDEFRQAISGGVSLYDDEESPQHHSAVRAEKVLPPLQQAHGSQRD